MSYSAAVVYSQDAYDEVNGDNKLRIGLLEAFTYICFYVYL